MDNNLTAMSVFVQAADTRSFTKTGNHLGVSSSAIGKTIARLEERLGVRLFHRNTRSITLTPEGALYLESCRRIFAEIEIAEQEFALMKLAPSGRLRVSLPMVGMLLMPVISSFAAAYPQINLDLDFSDKLVNVIEDGFDVVVRTGDALDSRLTARTLGTFSLRLVASPEYLARTGTPKHPPSRATGGGSPSFCDSADGPIGVQPHADGGTSWPPRQGTPLDAFRPAWASCIVTNTVESWRTAASTGLSAASVRSSQSPRSPAVMRPSGSAAVPSTYNIPAPDKARLPRWIRCQLVARPSSATY
jgi:DNA-binding transcriptional LysR family regulator